MTGWRASPRPGRRALGVALLAAVAVAPVLAQSQPESLLPPGFGDPVPEPEPSPAPTAPAPTPGTPAPAAPAPPADDDEDDDEADEDGEEIEEEPDPYDLPPEARRSTARVGLVGADGGGLGADAWGGADGRYLSRLMRRLDAPIASRWGSILLRRALVSGADTPRDVAGADWVGERAWLLIRMGEATDARALVQAVDVDQYSPKLFDVAMQASLATADPVGICPLTGAAGASARYAGWDLARAWCSALAGDAGTAAAIVDATRRRLGGRGIDLLLAEKLVAAGTGGRSAIAVEWAGVQRLSAWRYGLATATGVAIPDELMATVGPQVAAWAALAPMRAPADRAAPAATAARLGVLSNIAYVDLIGAVGDATDPSEFADTPAATLRAAHLGEQGDRLAALRTLWGAEAGDARFAAQVLTARAAARIDPSPDAAGDAAQLIAAMLTAGLDTRAVAWWPFVAEEQGDAWALLTVAAPRLPAAVDARAVDGYADADTAKGRLLIAALAGLGRIDEDDARSLAEEHEVPLGRRTRWTEAIERAAAAGQPGTVALLAAIGMQAETAAGIPPDHLYHIVRSLIAVGLEPEARMIAAEAIARA